MLSGRNPVTTPCPARRCLGGSLLAALVLVVGCTPAVDPGASPPAVPPPAEATKVAPRWVRVADLSGDGDHRSAFAIAAGAKQWRVTATCRTGRMRVALEEEPKALVDEACPTRAFGFSIRTGPQSLDIRATGPWEAVVEEQVDTALAEPPLAGMAERGRLATGTFFGVEQEGSGTATLYRLAGRELALRLDPFFVTPNDDLFVWASEAPAPRTSADALFTPHVQLEPLRATAGSQNYRLPDDLPDDRIRSIIIWCEPVRTAYAAAPLVRG